SSSTTTQPPVTTPAPPPPLPFPIPVNVGDARQVVTVAATGTTARLQRWELSPAGWQRVGADMPAIVGENGVTDHPREGASATPAGTFTLTDMFGSLPNPGVRLPYRQYGLRDWWVSDVRSRYYNQWYTCGLTCPF